MGMLKEFLRLEVRRGSGLPDPVDRAKACQIIAPARAKTRAGAAGLKFAES